MPPQVSFTHTDRVMFPEAGVTKGDVLNYYDQIAGKLLPHLRDRPMTLERLPEGLARGEKSPHFWQKHTPEYYPKWIPRVALKSERGDRVDYVLVNDKATLLYLVNQNVLTFHPFLSRVSSLETPDYVLFDIDPHQSRFGSAVKVAKQIAAELKRDKADAFVKTSGKSGLHVQTPWDGKRGGYDEARAWAMEVATRVVEAMPEVATMERNIKKRGRRVYLDVMQNALGHHVVPPYVVRATELATVSTPLEWRELTARLDPTKFTMAQVLRRVKGKKDPMRKLAGSA